MILLVILSLFFIFNILGFFLGVPNKVLFMSLISFFAMMLPVYINFERKPEYLAFMYGLSSGSIIISFSLFILPMVVRNNVQLGSLGVGFGIIMGYIIHTFGHQATHFKFLTISKTHWFELIIHSAVVGSILGVIYSQTPSISYVLGIAVISHKLPASFSVLLKLDQKKLIIIPSTSLGFAIISTNLLIDGILYSSLFLGIGGGILLHIAMDLFLECQKGSVYQVDEGLHNKIDKLRMYSLVSVICGGFIVLIFSYILGAV